MPPWEGTASSCPFRCRRRKWSGWRSADGPRPGVIGGAAQKWLAAAVNWVLGGAALERWRATAARLGVEGDCSTARRGGRRRYCSGWREVGGGVMAGGGGGSGLVAGGGGGGGDLVERTKDLGVDLGAALLFGFF